MSQRKHRARRQQAPHHQPAALQPTARVTDMRPARALRLPLAFTLLLVLFGLLPSARQNTALLWSFLGAGGSLLAWSAALLITARRANRTLSLEVVLRKQHYLQACAQLTVFAYWGWYWREVYDAAYLIAAQLVFAYAFDMLLTWSRRGRYTLGFGPFPVIFSMNLFLWFKVDWFYWQFLMIALGFAVKELIRWNKDGRRAHIFNPSSFPLGLFSLVLIVMGTTDLTWGPEIATTLYQAPHIYLLIFAVSLPAQFLFGVASMTLSAVATTYGLGLVYFATTGTYFFPDSSIPVAVFLGMHLLFNDPSTSPRTELGRIVFGVLYGLGVMILFGLLEQHGAPQHYDKLLAVPILNLMIKGIDTLARSSVLRRVDPATIGAALTPRRRNLAYIAVWAGVFAIMQVQTGTHRAVARADSLFVDGQAEAAIAHYRELVRNEPDYARAHNNLGYVLLSVGRPAEAVPPLRRAVELEPDNANMHHNLGLALIQADRAHDAAETLQRAVLLQPDYPEAHDSLADALFRDGQTEAAIAHYRELVRNEPDYAPGHNGLGYVLLSVGRPAEAVPPLRRAVELEPDNAETHYNLGLALLSVGRPAEAVPPLRRAVELEPDNAETHHNLGLALIQADRAHDAVETLQRAVLLQPDYLEAHDDLGQALFRGGQTEAAIAYYRELVRNEPDYAPGHNSLGYVLLSVGRPAEAVPPLRRAVELEPDNAETHYNLGLALIQADRSRDAVETLQRAVLLQPDYPEAHDNLGQALFRDGQTEAAIAYYRELVRNEPDYAPGHNSLGYVLLSVGRPAEAVPPLRRAVELEPDNAETHYNLGLALIQADRSRDAVETLQRAVLLEPDDYPEAHYSLAHAFANRGEAGKAVDEFREALRLRPDYEAALRDLALLLATTPAVDVRDPAAAVRLASRAAELTEWRDPLILDVLAGAYAAEGRFAEAIQTAETAERLVPGSAAALASQIKAHLSLYRQGRPPPPAR